MIDVNVHLDRWPFRRLPLDDTPLLVRKLRGLGITQAWACSFDAILHKDIGAVNARLVESCKRDGEGMLIPFGAVNPSLPDWQEDVRRCADVFHMRGVRLYPNYHGFRLDGPEFIRLLELATAARMIVQIAVSMEDERTQHPLVRVPPVDLAPLPDALAKIPSAKVVLLNALRQPRGPEIAALANVERAWFDVAVLESVGGIATLAEHIPAERLLFGSYAPQFYPEAAVLKFRELPPLPADVTDRILRGNATALLDAGGRPLR